MGLFKKNCISNDTFNGDKGISGDKHISDDSHISANKHIGGDNLSNRHKVIAATCRRYYFYLLTLGFIAPLFFSVQKRVIKVCMILL